MLRNMLKYFAIYYLKSKFFCFVAFLKKYGIPNMTRAIFLKCKIKLLYNLGIFLLIEENNCIVIQKYIYFIIELISYFLKILFIP